MSDTPATPKPWYASRAVWGGIIAGAAALAGVFGHTVGAEAQASLTDAAVALAGAVGGVLAIIGRIRAKRPIG